MNLISSTVRYTSPNRYAHLGAASNREYRITGNFEVFVGGYVGNNVYEFTATLIDGTTVIGKASKVRHLLIIKRAIERYDTLWESGADRLTLRRKCFHGVYTVDEDYDTIITLNVQLFIIRDFWARRGQAYA
jgi:hypothetical protein